MSAGPIWALGAMSGTSLDGVDAAMLRTDGQRIFEFGPTAYRPYSDVERSVLRAGLGHWELSEEVKAAAAVVEAAHAEILSGFEGADVVGFHGQTLAHDPRDRGTHQVGDGAALARALRLPVVWDFRTADVELGGEGAPLAPFFHWACANWIEAENPTAFLNLGGVGNLTWVDPSKAEPQLDGALLAFDTGPANAPVDDLMAIRRDVAKDTDGALAAEGTVDSKIMEAVLDRAFFYRRPPKSLDRNSFADLTNAVSGLGDADAVATLTAIAAGAVVRGLEECPAPPERLLVSGGGRKNRTLMAMLASGCDCAVAPVEDVELNGDMLEAQAFAFLAVRVMRGLPTTAPGTTGVAAPVGGGILRRPFDA